MLFILITTRRRGRRRGIDVRAGSVAQARMEAGLTLSQVAGGLVSRTAIHLIEKGRTRPSIETLMQIAARTNKPMSFFLLTDVKPPLREDTRLHAAKRHLAQEFAAYEATREPSVEAKVCILLGQVEEWCGKGARADTQFEKAIRILEELGKPEPLRDAHMAYAEILEGRADMKSAAIHWKLAANIGRLAALGLWWSATPEEGDSPPVRASGI
jgi:transcriptional regulator with XRE-family HTH domain